MKLCKFCNSSKGNAFQEGDCFLCGNSLFSLDEVAEKAAKELPVVPTFSVSTKIPREWLTREDIVWDLKLSGTVCIKTFMNQYLGRRISKLSGKKTAADGDVSLIIELPSKKISIVYNDLFVFGRYKKLAPGLSQTRWICSKCSGKGCKFCGEKGKLYHSVEEEMGEVLKKACEAADYTLHASGREDIDVVNTGGRPFVLQLAKARVRKPDLKAATRAIKKGKNVEVADLKIAVRGDVELVAASHFDKTYAAAVEFEREASDADLKKLLLLSGKVIEQKTPVRVKHRRADLLRGRKILGIKLVSHKGKDARFEITAEAGTYIKELITGDEGRTNPSFTSILGMKVSCRELKVIRINDSFLDSYF